MSFEQEKQRIVARCRRELEAAKTLDELAVGRDGPGTLAARWAIERYNEAILTLRKKYGMELKESAKGFEWEKQVLDRWYDINRTLPKEWKERLTERFPDWGREGIAEGYQQKILALCEKYDPDKEPPDLCSFLRCRAAKAVL